MLRVADQPHDLPVETCLSCERNWYVPTRVNATVVWVDALPVCQFEKLVVPGFFHCTS